jgi:imidazolonepropionase-like amidohydrolase
MLPALYLAAGVTTVRSPGSMEPEGDIGLQNRINSGRFLGPRYFNSGPYVEGDPVSVRWMQAVKTPEEVRLKIDQWIKQGATSVKIYAAMKGDLLRTAIEHGHAHGVKVIGHIGAVSAKEAIEMGIDELFHGILALPDIIPEEIDIKDYKKTYAFLAGLNVEQETIMEHLRMAAAYKVVITPTAAVMAQAEEDQNWLERQKKYLTPQALAVLQKRLLKPFFPDGDKILENIKKFIQMADKMGCILSTGTDQVGFSILPGFSLCKEMEIFSQAGLKNIDILKAATINGAYALGRSDILGTVEAGKLADFVVLNANPLKDIRNVRQVFRVIKGGVIYEPHKLMKPLEGKVY